MPLATMLPYHGAKVKKERETNPCSTGRQTDAAKLVLAPTMILFQNPAE
jgi:hypothetical protein